MIGRWFSRILAFLRGGEGNNESRARNSGGKGSSHRALSATSYAAIIRETQHEVEALLRRYLNP
jgi:hypothetical protein